MHTRKYFSIGADPHNDLQLAAPDIKPFHLLLHRDEAGQVLVSTRAPGALFSINDEECKALYSLGPQDRLALASQVIDWKAIFEISQEEIEVVEQMQSKAVETDKSLQIQLILIYAAIAALLILMAFYI